MKRYWKLISMAIVIILVIGTFYVNGSMALSENPDFLIKKVSGNEKEVENLSISGELMVDGQFQDNFHVDGTDTIYTSEFTFLDQLKRTYDSPEIKRLQRDYRNFMRGKVGNPALFYEDEEYLVYADGWDFHEIGYRSQSSPVHIEILNKKSKSVTEIQESLPNQSHYHYAFVEDVQKIDDQLKVIVRITIAMDNTVEHAEYMEEIHLYTFDLNQQRLIEDRFLTSANKNHHLNIINDSENLEPQKYLLIKKVQTEEIPGAEGIQSKEVKRSYIVYQYETNEQKELTIETKDRGSEVTSIEGSTIYQMNMSESGLEIHPYEIESGEFLQTRTLPIQIVKEDYFPAVKVTKNKIYAVSPYQNTETEAQVFVADLNTWDMLYEGKIEQIALAKNEKDYSLGFYGIYIEQ